MINVRVISNAKKSNVSEERERLRIYVTAPAVGGKANKAMVEILAKFLKVKKKEIRIIRGEKSREKVVEVDIEGD